MDTTIVNNNSILHLTQLDSQFGRIVDLYGRPPSWSRPEGFESLCKIILEQQVSLESGKAAYDKLAAIVPAFTPRELMKLSIQQMRAATISRQKAGYIIGLAQSIEVQRINLASLRHLDIQETLSVLTSIKGIGPWTAEVYMLFALQSPDIYPRGDIALINTIKELWQVGNSEEALIKSSDWAPYRSAASFLLWHYYLSKRGRVSPG